VKEDHAQVHLDRDHLPQLLPHQQSDPKAVQGLLILENGAC